MNLEFKKTCQISETSSALYYLRDNGEIYEMVMHIGLTNFEEKCVEVLVQNSPKVLEIGFGMGISANKFYSKNLTSYTCVEINDSIFLNAQNWGVGKNNVNIVNDDWKTFLTGTTSKYDLIYCDYLEQDDYQDFYEKSKSILNTNGIISTYGAGIYLGMTEMNFDDTIAPPLEFDSDFTQQIYNNLVTQGFYKVYWQYFNGTNYVKNIN